MAEIGVITARGFAPDAVTLNGLFKYRGEALEYVKDARPAGTYFPACGLSYQLLLKGGSCPLAVAWYNATIPATRPTANDLHVLIAGLQYRAPATGTPPGMACIDSEFCPLATHDTTMAPLHGWTDQVYGADIRKDPAYRGGLIGFAIIGEPQTLCPDTHYSQTELNPPVAPLSQPWISTLTWKSTKYADSYYIGFEDSPALTSDDDFNDIVVFVSGLSRKAGGATGGAGGTSGGGQGTGGTGGMGANCLIEVQAAGYASGTNRCADCKDNIVSQEDKCKAMSDCMAARWPCTRDCEASCANMSGASTVVNTCVAAIAMSACN